MTVTKMATVFELTCDICGKQIEVEAENAKGARMRARVYGWTYGPKQKNRRTTGDRCASCAYRHVSADQKVVP